MYQVQIDRSRCEGHAKCVIECPEVFDLDDQGFGIVTGGDIAEELRPAVQRAIDGCPEYAISASE
jgi:ferredoxin